MSEASQNGPERRKRSPLKHAATVAGALILGAIPASNTDAPSANVLSKIPVPRWLDVEKQRLEKSSHATSKYLSGRTRTGNLEDNYLHFRGIASRMLRGDFDLNNPDDTRSALIDELITPILAERDQILKELDPELIPELLVLYVANNTLNKSLIEAYIDLGGDLASIRAKGRDGVDMNIVGRIFSNMKYSMETRRNKGNYGKIFRSDIGFGIIDEIPEYVPQ